MWLHVEIYVRNIWFVKSVSPAHSSLLIKVGIVAIRFLIQDVPIQLFKFSVSALMWFVRAHPTLTSTNDLERECKFNDRYGVPMLTFLYL